MFQKMLLATTLSALLWIAAPGSARAESFRPLRTQTTQTLAAHEVEVGLALEYRHDTTFPFTRASEQPERDELELPRFELRYGLADHAEFQLEYAYRSIDEEAPGVGSESGSGDARFFTKIRLLDQDGVRPELGIRAGAKLPNAEDRQRLGTDEADLFVEILLGKHTARWSAAVNLGLGILGEPSRASAQDDVLTYSAGAVCKLTDTLDLAAELNGAGFSNKANDTASLLAALRYHWQAFRFYVGASAGLTERAEAFGVLGGVTWSHPF